MEQVEQYIRTGGRDMDARRASLEWLVMVKPWTLAQAEAWLDAMVRTFNPSHPVTALELRDALGIGDTPAEAWDKLVAAMAAEVPWWVWAALYRLEWGLAWLQRWALIGWVWLTQRPGR